MPDYTWICLNISEYVWICLCVNVPKSAWMTFVLHFPIAITSQLAWMHLRCIFETFHTVSQRQLKEGWFANLWDFSPEMIKGVSSETSLRSLRFTQGRLWVASETVILGLQTKAFFVYLFIYLPVFIFFAKLN